MSAVPTLSEIELAVVRHFNHRQRLIVPNVYWGLGFNHELDLCAVTKAGYLDEIEIKVSCSDLRADRSKAKWRPGVYDRRVRSIWFALPEWLASQHCDLVPEHAGILAVAKTERGGVQVRIDRRPKTLDARKLRPDELLKLAHLGAMRIWDLKKGILHLKSKLEAN